PFSGKRITNRVRRTDRRSVLRKSGRQPCDWQLYSCLRPFASGWHACPPATITPAPRAARGAEADPAVGRRRRCPACPEWVAHPLVAADRLRCPALADRRQCPAWVDLLPAAARADGPPCPTDMP